MAVEYEAEKSDLRDLTNLATLPFRLIDRGCQAVSRGIENRFIDSYIQQTSGSLPRAHHARLKRHGIPVWVILAYDMSVKDTQKIADDYNIRPVEVAAAKIFHRRNQEVLDAKILLASF